MFQIYEHKINQLRIWCNVDMMTHTVRFSLLYFYDFLQFYAIYVMCS
jgi:hypothetical protein